MDIKCRTDSPLFHIDPAHDEIGDEPETLTLDEIVDKWDEYERGEWLMENLSPYEMSQLFDALFEADVFQLSELGDKVYRRLKEQNCE
jgi:hypothetical protein